MKPTVELRTPPTDKKLRHGRRSRPIQPELYESNTEPKGKVIWANNVEVRRMVFYVEPELALKFRAHCANREATMSSVINEMMAQCLDGE